MLSQKQRAILNALRATETITLDDAVQLIGQDIYCNEHKHVGALLANMVKRGLIERVTPGVFRIVDGSDQTELFSPATGASASPAKQPSPGTTSAGVTGEGSTF